MTDKPDQQQASTLEYAGSEPSPRSFCHASGLIFQTVGLVLSLSGCCWWSTLGHWQEALPIASEGKVDVPRLEDASQADIWSMIAVPVVFVAGMALMVLGLGLQHERISSGKWAMWMTAVVALFFWCYLGFAIFAFPAFWRIVMGILLAIIWTVSFLLAGASVEQLKKFPPSKQTEQAWTSRDEDDLRNAISPHSRDKTNP